MSRLFAQLIEDGGASAGGGVGGHPSEFFRGAHFLEAEGATHTLRIETDDAELLAPLIVRQIGDGPDLDAVSPYGYPGFTVVDDVPPGGAAPDRVRSNPRIARENANSPGKDPGWIDPGEVDFSRTGLVSAFIRHRLDLVPLAGSTERNVVQIADPALKPKSRPSDRRQVRRNLEAGYAVELIPGADTTDAQRAAFLDLYEQTMRRTDAAPHYFFGAEYFDRIFPADRTWLALATDPEGAPAAASIACVSDGYLHYYLSGSADSRLGDSPMKNVLALLIEHAGELELPLNLGGGIHAGDALEEFKRGFANRSLAWRTSELICDPARYAELTGDRDAGGFFPAYRAPA
ncbi:MAG TPA: GNAT family N-acetyltransferase [Solirubrobacterales bacterium]|nr:GNAT family N-acetyltransferase [Solirubrobacterales bacterium]